MNCKALISEHVGDTLIINAILTDITEQQKDKERLRLAEEEYRIAAHQSKQTIGRYDIAEKTLTITEEASARLALPKRIDDVPYGRVKLGKISADTIDAYVSFYEKIIAGEKECTVTFQKLLQDKWCWIGAHSTTIYDENQNPVSAIISYTDVTEQQEKEAVYIKWQQNLKDIGKTSYTLYRCNLNRNNTYDTVEGELLDFHTETNSIKTFNERTCDFANQCVCAEDREKYISFVDSDKMLASYHRGKRSGEIEFRGITSKGVTHWIKLSVELVEYPNTTEVAAYLMYEDINKSKTQAIQVKTQAETDPLTGLFNRKTFEKLVNQAISSKKSNTVSAMFLMDMDGFKLVNDSLGHSAGDQVLIDAGTAIRSIIRDSDLACRMGGDEFLVYLRDMPDKEVILKKARQLCSLTNKTLNIGVKVSISLGIAVYPDDGIAFETLYRKADKALYYIKEHGKNSCAFFNSEMTRQDKQKKSLSNGTDDSSEQTKRKMLIIDDSEINRMLLSNIFSNDFEVITVQNGQEALIYLRRNSSDVSIILLDLIMPGLDGFTVLDKIHSDLTTQIIPVIVVSGVDDRETNLRVIRAGASDFVTKPVDSELLKIRVASAISKAENERLRIQNHELSIQKYEMEKIRIILDDNGAAIVEYNGSNNTFIYDQSMMQHIAGCFDSRTLWDILREDGIASKKDIEKLKQLADSLCKDTKSKSLKTIISLRSSSGDIHQFNVKILKCSGDISPCDRVYIVFTDINMPE